MYFCDVGKSNLPIVVPQINRFVTLFFVFSLDVHVLLDDNNIYSKNTIGKISKRS